VRHQAKNTSYLMPHFINKIISFMMIGVAESLIRTNGFNGEDMARAFVRNYELEPFRGYGPGPPHIFLLIRAGEAWDKAAQKLYYGGSYGNSSAMRIAPLGVFYHDNPDRLRGVAYTSSQITHAHHLGKEGAALQAYAIALVTNLEPHLAFDRSGFLVKLADYVEDKVYQQKLCRINELLTAPDKAKVADELGNGLRPLIRCLQLYIPS